MSAITQEQFDRLEAEKKALADEVKSLRDEGVKAIAKEVEIFKTRCGESDKVIAKLREDLDGYKEVVKVKDEEIVKAKAEVAIAQKAVADLKAELDKITADKIASDRLAKLVEVVGAERANDLNIKFASVSDDIFAELVATFAQTATQKTKAATKSLDTAKVEDKLNLGVTSDKTIDIQKAAASWIGGFLSSNATKAKQ